MTKTNKAKKYHSQKLHHNTHKIKIGKTRIRVIVLCIGCAFAPQRELNKAVEAHTIISTEFSGIKLN